MSPHARGLIFPARKSLPHHDGRVFGEGKLVRQRADAFFVQGNVTPTARRFSGAAKIRAPPCRTPSPRGNFRPRAGGPIFCPRKSVPRGGGEVFRRPKFHPPRAGNFSGSPN